MNPELKSEKEITVELVGDNKDIRVTTTKFRGVIRIVTFEKMKDNEPVGKATLDWSIKGKHFTLSRINAYKQGVGVGTRYNNRSEQILKRTKSCG